MKTDRAAALRDALDEDRLRLDAAVAALKIAAVKPLLGRRVARSPWAWLLVAGAAGAWLGLRKTRD